MSPPAPNKSLRHQADRTARTRRLRRSGAPKDRCVRTGSPREGAAGFSAPRFARPRQPRAAGSVSPAPPRSPSRSAQPLPPPRETRTPTFALPRAFGVLQLFPDQAASARAHPSPGCRVQPRRAQPHRQAGSQFCPGGMAHGAAAPDPLGGGSARPRPEAASRGEQIRGARLRRSSWCWAAEDVPHHPQTPRVSFRRPLREDGYLFAALALCAPARARAFSILRLSLSLSLQKLDLYRSRPRCHRRQTVMKSKETNCRTGGGRDSAFARPPPRRGVIAGSQRAWGWAQR